MTENTKIEWTDHTFNGWVGCEAISPGCANCYAADWAKRYGRDFAIRTRTAEANWKQPIKWNARHDAFFAEHGRRQRVFCSSLADVFDKEVPRQWRQDLFDLILATQNLDWLLLTKRIGNVARMLEEIAVYRGALMDASDHYRPLPNVWIGATVVNQEEADRDIPKLLGVPAHVRFLSMEPLLGPVNLRLPIRKWTNSAGDASCDHCCNGDRCDDRTHYERGRPEWRIRCPHCRGTGNGRPIDWVIVGGESGHGARPMHPEWASSLRDQCEAAGVPFLYKQHGEWAPGSGDFGSGRFRTAAIALDGRIVGGGFDATEYPPGATSADGWAMVHRAGKRAAGRLLDGRTHDEFPEAG